MAGKDVTVRASHFIEMRAAIQELWSLASMGTVPEFTAGQILAGSRLISLRDPGDLRSWLGQYESSSWASQNGRRARAVYRYDDYSDGSGSGYPKGRRTEMWDGCGWTRWTYDARGRIIIETRITDGAIYTTIWTYDSMDRVVTVRYPDGETVTYTYNSQLLLQSMSGSVVGAIASDLTYNALGLPTLVKLPNAVQDLYLRYRYHVLDAGSSSYPFASLWDIRLEKTGANQLRLQHYYDSARNVSNIVQDGGEDMSYYYDDLDRLTSRRVTGGAQQELFVYNEIGNIVSTFLGPYAYDPARKHAVIDDGSQTYAYDANGNMTRRGSAEYLKYDAENRVVKVSNDIGGTQYLARMAYDGDGKRVKRVDNYGAIHYIGNYYERNVGTSQEPTEVVTKYYYARMGKVTRLIALRRGTALFYIVPDHLGGTLRTVDASGNLVDDIRYNAFGETRSGGTATPTDKRFTGQTLDASTGLYDYGARLYAPGLGRFISPDPVVPNPKNPQSLNRYSYALNNPLRYIDPTGYDDEEPGDGGQTQEPESPGGDPNSYDLDWAGGGPDPSGIPPDWDIPSPEVAPEPMPDPEPPQPVMWVPETDSPQPAAPEVEALADQEPGGPISGRPAGANDTRVFAPYYPVRNEQIGFVSDYSGDLPLFDFPVLVGVGRTSFYSGPLAGQDYVHGGGGLGLPSPSVSAMVGLQESPGGWTVNVSVGLAFSLTVDPGTGRTTGFMMGLASPGFSVDYHPLVRRAE